MQTNGAFRFKFIGESMETETTTWPEFPNGGKPQTSAYEKQGRTIIAASLQNSEAVGVLKVTCLPLSRHVAACDDYPF